MKLKVNRQLSAGTYSVDFSVGDFTADEVKKMESFGIPRITVLQGSEPGVKQAYKVQLTKISPQFRAGFGVEAEAKKYEEEVVAEIRKAMKALRERTDDFSSTQEVDV
jgi:hypothetical protein